MAKHRKPGEVFVEDKGDVGAGESRIGWKTQSMNLGHPKDRYAGPSKTGDNRSLQVKRPDASERAHDFGCKCGGCK